jgi:hypothetical protein
VVTATLDLPPPSTSTRPPIASHHYIPAITLIPLNSSVLSIMSEPDERALKAQRAKALVRPPPSSPMLPHAEYQCVHA